MAEGLGRGGFRVRSEEGQGVSQDGHECEWKSAAVFSRMAPKWSSTMRGTVRDTAGRGVLGKVKVLAAVSKSHW